MPVWELRAEVASSRAAELEDWLAESEEQRLMLLEDKPSGRAWLVGYFTAKAEAEAMRGEIEGWPAAGALATADISEVADRDWKESYRAHFKAWRFGPLAWVPVWERETFVPKRGEKILWLDPGMAFGTGNHETTRLVVERMVELAAEAGASGRVIDAGCGSGILALSAALLGHTDVAAFDNDPLAVDVSRENAGLNGLAGRVEFFVGDLVTGLAGRHAELVLANIQADVLMRFARELLGAVAPGGTLVLSGILATELSQVRDAFGARVPGWRVDSRTMGEWSDLRLSDRSRR